MGKVDKKSLGKRTGGNVLGNVGEFLAFGPGEMAWRRMRESKKQKQPGGYKRRRKSKRRKTKHKRSRRKRTMKRKKRTGRKKTRRRR